MAKRPHVRLLALGLLIAAGLSLYFWFGPRAPVVVRPVETESPQ